jgi:hypothetical protein
LQELATPFLLAVVQLEYAEWLIAEQRAEEAGPLLAEADAVFERLDARPWLRRAEQAAGAGAVTGGRS